MDASERKQQLRRQVEAESHPDASTRRRVVDNVGTWLQRRSPSVVVGFLAMGEEIDMTPLVSEHPRIRFGLTRTAPGMGLTVHDFGGPREMHRFGFEQPAAEAPEIQPDEIDVVLVPGIAFTRDGRRLGRGAGYYDRFLANVGADKVALTTSSRILADLPREPHDVLMDWLATEDGVFPAH